MHNLYCKEEYSDLFRSSSGFGLSLFSLVFINIRTMPKPCFSRSLHIKWLRWNKNHFPLWGQGALSGHRCGSLPSSTHVSVVRWEESGSAHLLNQVDLSLKGMHYTYSCLRYWWHRKNPCPSRARGYGYGVRTLTHSYSHY